VALARGVVTKVSNESAMAAEFRFIMCSLL